MLIGATTGWLGQSLWLREVHGREDGAPPPVDLAAEKANGDFVRTHILNGTIRACHDVSDGGILVALAEMAMASGIGARLLTHPRDIPGHAFWFGEDQARYLVAVPDHAGLTRIAEAAGIPAVRLGTSGGQDLTLLTVVQYRLLHCESACPVFSGLDERRNQEGHTPMAMAANEIEALVKEALPDAKVTVEDLAGDGDHYAATVVSESFRGVSRVKQHKMVYDALRGRMGGELHALALQTSAPE